MPWQIATPNETERTAVALQLAAMRDDDVARAALLRDADLVSIVNVLTGFCVRARNNQLRQPGALQGRTTRLMADNPTVDLGEAYKRWLADAPAGATS